jgi:hypothetical protein
VAPFGVAIPMAIPPPVTPQLPVPTTEGGATSSTNWYGVSSVQVAGADIVTPGVPLQPEPGAYASTAGDAIEHDTPLGAPHEQALHARPSSTPV